MLMTSRDRAIAVLEGKKIPKSARPNGVVSHKLASLLSEIENFKKYLNDLDSYKSSFDYLSSEYDKIKSENDQLKTSVAELKEKIGLPSTAYTDTQLKEQIEMLKKQVEMLKAQLTATLQDCQKLRSGFFEIEAQNRNLHRSFLQERKK